MSPQKTRVRWPLRLPASTRHQSPLSGCAAAVRLLSSLPGLPAASGAAWPPRRTPRWLRGDTPLSTHPQGPQQEYVLTVAESSRCVPDTLPAATPAEGEGKACKHSMQLVQPTQEARAHARTPTAAPAEGSEGAQSAAGRAKRPPRGRQAQGPQVAPHLPSSPGSHAS